MVWLGLGRETTWLGLGKDQVLTQLVLYSGISPDKKKNLVFCCKFPKHPKTENDNCSVQLSHHCHLLLTGKSARLPETGMWYDMFFLETSSSHENSTYWWFAETYNANTLFCRLEHHTGIEKKGKNWVESIFFCFRAIS